MWKCRAPASINAIPERRLNQLIDLAEKGVSELMEAQKAALGDCADVICRKPKLVLASNNFGKLRELRAMLGDTFDVRSMRDMGIQLEVDETGETFEENALLKAQALMDIYHCATLADDSGLCVRRARRSARRAFRALLRRSRRRRGEQPAAPEGA